MKRNFYLTLLLLASLLSAEARHIAGGEMSYEYLGQTTSGTYRYRINLKLYRDCYSGGAQLDAFAAITIYAAGAFTPYLNLSVPLGQKVVSQLTSPGPCIDNPPAICYEIGYYSQEVELPATSNGYSISYQRCCRIENISNVVNSSATGTTYAAFIPGTSVSAVAMQNTSARFVAQDTVVICENNGFLYNFGATDPDNDQLSYEFDIAYDGASQATPQPNIASAPPYSSIPYAFPFSATSPLGSAVSINPSTGMISGIAPAAGIYVLTVVAIESRRGQIINRHRKDLHIKVAPCAIAAADLEPEYISCEGFSYTFRNRSNSSLIKTYYWDFGAPGLKDTSNQEIPTFTFPDTGRYQIMLITNRNQNCSDTAIAIAKVYPGFYPKFSAAVGCKESPTKFTDQTTTKYGTVNFWQWSFGNPLINPDISRIPNPSYTYPTTGNYQVQLIVATNLGCRDTIESSINIQNKPTLRITNDTLICSIDTLKLSAMGNGTITWTPNYMISNTSVPEPLVSPDVPTTYYAKLFNGPGCENLDSVFVDVRPYASVFAGNDTTICLTDSILLKPTSEGTQFLWSPPDGLNDPTLKFPIAKPGITSTYTVIANIGKCQAMDEIKITTVPYPVTVVSPDTVICFGDSIRIFASGGSSYSWRPAASLNNSIVPNPMAKPSITTTYTVSVFENKGCPKPTIDSTIVAVVPKVKAFAGNDTAIVIGQPFQLQATGGRYYSWTPATGLSNPFIPDPIAFPIFTTTYVVKVSVNEGCFQHDTINVKVFYTGPDIFIPTAFTPNGDKLNDNLIPIPVGISRLDFFRIYNRFGELVFSTTEIGKGWNGKFREKEQNTGTYAWYVQGIDFNGKTIFKKGTSTLIR